jgi:hypothetical protein
VRSFYHLTTTHHSCELDRARIVGTRAPDPAVKLSLTVKLAVTPAQLTHGGPHTEVPCITRVNACAQLALARCEPMMSLLAQIDKIRLLGFTTLHDSRRYTIPRCLLCRRPASTPRT